MDRQITFQNELNGIRVERIMRNGQFEMTQKHFHAAYEIYYLYSGERTYFIGNQTYHVKPGSLVFINSNEIHKTSGDHAALHERLLFDMKQCGAHELQKFLPTLSVTDFFKTNNRVLQFTGNDQIWLEDKLDAIQFELSEKPPNWESMFMLKLAELFVFASRKLIANPGVIESPVKTERKYEKVHDITTYITDHYTDAISLEHLARQFYMSKYHLCHIFKEVTGLTVIQYQNITRVQKAQVMLRDSLLPVTEIASLTGFDSITYFERIFKKYSGTSPSLYRKKRTPGN